MIASLTLGYEEARRALDLAVAEVGRREKAAVAVVADSHGETIAFARMDGAPLSSIAIATNKAWTAARAGKPSADIGKKALTDPAFDCCAGIVQGVFPDATGKSSISDAAFACRRRIRVHVGSASQAWAVGTPVWPRSCMSK